MSHVTLGRIIFTIIIITITIIISITIIIIIKGMAFVVTSTFITHALNVLQEIRDGDHRDEKSAHWWKRKTDFVAWLAQDDRAPLAGQGWARLTGLERKLADLVKTKMDERIRVTEEYEQRLAQEVDEAKEQ